MNLVFHISHLSDVIFHVFIYRTKVQVEVFRCSGKGGLGSEGSPEVLLLLLLLRVELVGRQVCPDVSTMWCSGVEDHHLLLHLLQADHRPVDVCVCVRDQQD